MNKREERRNLVRIVGSGGKGGGREPIEVDDNMYARQHAAFIDAIAEGPIKGLVYGDSSIIVDEITHSISKYEPRVELINVEVQPYYDSHAYDVLIEYHIVGIDVPAQRLSFVLESYR